MAILVEVKSMKSTVKGELKMRIFKGSNIKTKGDNRYDRIK